MRGLALLMLVTVLACEAAAERVALPGGVFRMGGDDALARPDEQPPHPVRVGAFTIDATEVTNAQFAAFVEDTGYVTTAEQAVDWNTLKATLPPGTPRPAPELLAPGGLVFRAPERPVDLRRWDQWWAWVPGAQWRHPTGPGSGIAGLEDHPVVQVSHTDAAAYAAWAGGRLPTEAEWEYAARGGLLAKLNVWGDAPIDATRANTWQGDFPRDDTGADGFTATAPVRTYPPNGFGLFGMAGNVWEWCADAYDPRAYAARDREAPTANPRVTAAALPAGTPLMRVQRGGSFLCNDAYCASYRPSARMPCTPDTSSNHTGFRCVFDTPDPYPLAPTRTP